MAFATAALAAVIASVGTSSDSGPRGSGKIAADNEAVNVTGRISRNAHRLFVPQLRTNYGKRSLYYRGTILWNALPAALYHASTLFQFRSSYLEQYNCS